MGVRHLQTFMQNYVPCGFIKVSIADECNKFRRINKYKPIIIIDLYALIDTFQVNDAEILCGGRFNHFQVQYDMLLKNLSTLADLVFFEDGSLMDLKVETWISRQNHKYAKSIEVINCFDKEWRLEDVVKRAPFIPKTTYHRAIIEETAKRYGRLIKSVARDCDTEIAKYAVNNPKVLAVLASDTDFLIFEGHWKYFSVRDLNTQTLETMEYNRKSLRKFLCLSDDQLILLSTFSGNDLVQYESVRNFHEECLGPDHKFCDIRFNALADFIRRSQLRDMIRQISYYTDDEGMDVFDESVDMYNLKYDDYEETNELLNFCLSKDFFFVSEILKFNIQTFTMNYLDLRKPCLQKLPHAYIKLLRKQIGIVFMHDRDQVKNVGHQVITKMSFEDDYQLCKIAPIYPDFTAPPLDELFNRKEFPQHDNIRFDLLAWTLSDKTINFNKKIPQNYFLDILVVKFLLENELITSCEANLILLTVHAEEEKIFANAKISPTTSQLNPRAIQICFLFIKLYLYVQHSLEVTGLKDVMKLINFDGVLFHKIYSAHQLQSFDFQSVLGELVDYF